MNEHPLKFVEYINPSEDVSYKDIEGYSGPGWYFWDETETRIYGPFLSADDAEEALHFYAENL